MLPAIPLLARVAIRIVIYGASTFVSLTAVKKIMGNEGYPEEREKNDNGKRKKG